MKKNREVNTKQEVCIQPKKKFQSVECIFSLMHRQVMEAPCGFSGGAFTSRNE